MTETKSSSVTPYRWPLVLVLLIAAISYLVHCAMNHAKDVAATAPVTIQKGLDAVVDVAEGFQSQNITQTFTAALPKLTPTDGANLELAMFKATENFKRENTRRILWDQISLGTTVTEIRVKVAYRYHLRLKDPWRLETEDKTCIVHAPRIRPSLPPAIDTTTMEKRTSEGWLRFNATEQMDALERNITPALSAYAADKEHMAYVREKCRKGVEGFVRNWLLREDQWRDDRFTAVIVRFDDEIETDTSKVENEN